MTLIAETAGGISGGRVFWSYAGVGRHLRIEGVPELWYTGDKVHYDGSDTDCYGEPCEPGTGYTLEHGWVDPCWSRGDIFGSADQVSPDVWERFDGPMIDWLVDKITERLGWVEMSGLETTAGTPRTFYAETDEEIDISIGDRIRLAVHMENVPDNIARAVAYTIAYRQRQRQRGETINL
jgi:hypothetical protein